MANPLKNSRLRKALKKVAQPQTGWLDVFPAVIGKADGTVQTGVNGIIYIRNLLNGQVLTVYNFITPNTSNLQVEVGRKVETPGLWQVKGVREAYSVPAGGSVSSGSHTHEQLFIGRDRFTPFLTLPIDGGEFMVQIYGDVITKTGGTFEYIPNQTLDLSSYVPASGAEYVVIEADEDGVIYVNEGTPVDAKELLTLADIPATTVGRFPSCAVRLYDGQTQLYRDPSSINDFVDLRYTDPNLKADYVKLSRLGTTVRRDLQYMQDVIHSTGWISGGAITDNGDGSIGVASGIGTIRATDSNLVPLYFADWATDASISLTDDSINYIYIDYNSGTPIPVASTTEPTEYNTKIVLAKVYRNGTELHINETIRHTIGDHASLMMQSMQETMPFAWVDGAVISEVGTRQFSISEGNWWNGLTRFTTTAFDGTTDTFNMYYRDGVGGWTEVSGQTEINNTQYDDGDGTLGTLTAARYGVHWIFLATDGNVHDVLGQGDYTAAQALAATIPTTLPPEILTDSRIAAKIIIQKSDSVFTSLVSFIGISGSSPSGGSGWVESVNGETGAVVIDPDDLDDTLTANKLLNELRPASASMFLHDDSGISFRETNVDGSFRWIKGDFGSGGISGYLRSQFQGLVSTTELIANGDFETGDFTGWTQTGSPTITGNAFNGSYCAKCTASNTVKQTITVVSGEYYLLEFAVKMDSDSDFHGVVIITNGDQAAYDAGNQYGGKWIRGAVLIRATSTSMTLEFKAVAGTNFVYFDEITLKLCSVFSLEGMNSSGQWHVISTSANPLIVNGTNILALVSDEAYGSGWDADTTHAPSRNAVYDKVEVLLQELVTGWLSAAETWTRTGNHTFTISGDVTTKYRKGANIRYKDGGAYEYGVIGSSSYSSPNTTVNLIPNNDFAMAAATITDRYISYIARPEGFPSSFNRTPTLTATAPLTITASTLSGATWSTIGTKMHEEIRYSAITFGVAGTTFTVSCAVTPTGNNIAIPIIQVADNGGAQEIGNGFITGNNFRCRRNLTAAFTAAAGGQCLITSDYDF